MTDTLHSRAVEAPPGVTFAEAIAALETIAPLGLAETWDNVGLLLPPPSRAVLVERVFFTIDLTEPVFEEALEASAGLIVTYHPIIFQGLKRLDPDVAQHRVLLGAIRAGVPVYSPHTSLDAAPRGMNDWLADGLGAGERRPITPPKIDLAGAGMGRVVALEAPAPLRELATRLKKHLGIDNLRIAEAPRHAHGKPIRRVAVSAGAGGELFQGLGDVDLLVTGEMRHHDVLARVAEGTSVILAEHTNSERGHLPFYAARFAEALTGRVAIEISSRDRDPLAFG